MIHLLGVLAGEPPIDWAEVIAWIERYRGVAFKDLALVTAANHDLSPQRIMASLLFHATHAREIVHRVRDDVLPALKTDGGCDGAVEALEELLAEEP